MNEVLLTVLPIFALIGLGFGVGRARLIDAQTSKGLAAFTFTLAIPAMLFRTMATAELPDVAPAAIWLCFFGSAFATWMIATALTIPVLRRPIADSAPIAMSASYGNVVMVGLPLALTSLGPDAAGPIALILSAHSPTLFAVASLHLALTGAHRGESLTRIFVGVLNDLVRNPLIVAIIAGTLWRLTGLGLHPLADQTLEMLGRAAVPCALVSLGLSLVGFQIAGQAPTLFSILVLKLAAMPAIAWVLADQVFALPVPVAGVIILFAAMPTGANAYLFAQQQGRAVNSASASVALGTGLSLFTASIVLIVLNITK
ncbi:MAG: AEC family transporter [Pseudomonadota bacterium]